ncbi:MAG: hypothetical protein ABIP97_02535 [Chthoniobacterales bacterium]
MNIKKSSFQYLALIITACVVISANAAPTADSAKSATDSGSNIDWIKDLSSQEGLMRLVPELKNAEGKFEVPNPMGDKKALEKFMNVHQTLMRLIEMALVQANIHADPYKVHESPKVRVQYPSDWLSSEIGVQTQDAGAGCVKFELAKSDCASWKVNSFLSRMTAMDCVNGRFYYSLQKDAKSGKVTTPSLVYTQSTAVPGVSRLVLASVESVGIWQPGFVLHSPDGKAFLIVNICVDLYDATNKSYGGYLITAIHQPGTCSTSGTRASCHR